MKLASCSSISCAL